VNIVYNDIKVGMTAKAKTHCTPESLYIFARASGNLNPLNLPNKDGDADGENEAIAPGIWLASLVSAVVGNQLPGPGTRLVSQTLEFMGTAKPGDNIIAQVEGIEKQANRHVLLSVHVSNQDKSLLVSGQIGVIAPAKPISIDDRDVPEISLSAHIHFDKLIIQAQALPTVDTVVICPEEPDALNGALLARQRNLIAPVLVGDEVKIKAAAKTLNADISDLTIIHQQHATDAANLAVDMVLGNSVQAIMKGHLHTDVLLKSVVRKVNGLRTHRRLSHAFVLDVPALDHLLIITDAAINIAPDLKAKVDIVQNAIDLALSIGISEPKVGVLSAVETINPAIPSTLDAAALSKMADRGQIKGGLVDGPLAMDNAINMKAAQTKGLKSLVAGSANILLGPNLESSNMLAKELTYLGNTNSAGIVLGARCPIILTSRSDSDYSRLASCAIAAIYAHSNRP
jgi:phosphate butyryltransferase